MYRERNRVECPVNRLKAHRYVATRYEQRAAHYLTVLLLATLLLWM